MIIKISKDIKSINQINMPFIFNNTTKQIESELEPIKQNVVTITIVTVKNSNSPIVSKYLSIAGFEACKKEDLRLQTMEALNRNVVSDIFHGVPVLRTNPMLNFPYWYVPRLTECLKKNGYHVIVKEKEIEFHVNGAFEQLL
jgi:hypothetical protein